MTLFLELLVFFAVWQCSEGSLNTRKEGRWRVKDGGDAISPLEADPDRARIATDVPPFKIEVQSSTEALVIWRLPPLVWGGQAGFKLSLESLSEPNKPVRDLVVRARPGENSARLQGLTPGASYTLQIFSALRGPSKSDASIAAKFTTRPHPLMGSFSIEYVNETTLLVEWQYPLKRGFFTAYKISIHSQDSISSETIVPKNDCGPGKIEEYWELVNGVKKRRQDYKRPCYAAFSDLVPGQAYNISVATVSESLVSDPFIAQVKTLPIGPLNETITELGLSRGMDSWGGGSADEGIMEFGGYDKPSFSIWWPAKTYPIATVSASMASNPATIKVTTNTEPANNNIEFLTTDIKGETDARRLQK